MGRKSKRTLILEQALIQKDLERKRITEILKLTGRYTDALNPLIDTYLDAHEIYCIKYSEWKDAEFKATKIHTNKKGARNEVKHPFAQQVEVWMDKKTKLLGQLGLDAKNAKLGFTGPLASEQPEAKEDKNNQNNKLLAFKNRANKKG